MRYSYDITSSETAEIDFSETVRGIVSDFRRGTGRPVIAARFHNTVAAAAVEIARSLSDETDIEEVVLTGGVFQNRHLLQKVTAALRALGLKPFTNTRVPANDAGISLGQAYLLLARI